MADEPQMVYRGHTLVGNSEFWDKVNTHFPDFAQIKNMITEAYRVETGQSNATEREVRS